jgi:2-oxoisovalerate dehydrogenase E1 component
MPGFIHLYVGEEATAVGVCANLRRDDWVTSTHRGHGHALAKGVSAAEVLAELYGKAGGCCGGRGGSMHLYKLDAGLFGTIRRRRLPATVGLGCPHAGHRPGRGGVLAMLVNHGAFHESPPCRGAKGAVVFVCENTGCRPPAGHGHLNTESPQAAATVFRRAVGQRRAGVHRVAGRAVECARSGDGPT